MSSTCRECAFLLQVTLYSRQNVALVTFLSFHRPSNSSTLSPLLWFTTLQSMMNAKLSQQRGRVHSTYASFWPFLTSLPPCKVIKFITMACPRDPDLCEFYLWMAPSVKLTDTYFLWDFVQNNLSKSCPIPCPFSWKRAYLKNSTKQRKGKYVHSVKIFLDAFSAIYGRENSNSI